MCAFSRFGDFWMKWKKKIIDQKLWFDPTTTGAQPKTTTLFDVLPRNILPSHLVQKHITVFLSLLYNIQYILFARLQFFT